MVFNPKRPIRSADIEETYQWFDRRKGLNYEELVGNAYATSDFSFTIRDSQGDCVVLAMGHVNSVDTCTVGVLGTDKWDSVILETTRTMHKHMKDIWASGVKVIDCYSADWREDSHKWIKSLGGAETDRIRTKGLDVFIRFEWRR